MGTTLPRAADSVLSTADPPTTLPATTRPANPRRRSGHPMRLGAIEDRLELWRHPAKSPDAVVGLSLDGADAATEHLGGLRLGEVVQEPQHDHRALFAGQPRQCTLQQQAQRRTVGVLVVVGAVGNVPGRDLAVSA